MDICALLFSQTRLTTTNKKGAYGMQMIEYIMCNYNIACILLINLILTELGVCKKRKRTQVVLPYNISGRVHTPINHLNRFVGVTDNDSLVNFRMDQNAFRNLCSMFRRIRGL